MLSDEEKRRLEADAAAQMRRYWGDIRAGGLAAAIDDIRARVVEEAWFGRPFYNLSTAVTDAMREHRIYARETEAMERGRELEATQDRDRLASQERDDALER